MAKGTRSEPPANVERCDYCYPNALRKTKWTDGQLYDPQTLQRIHWYNEFSLASLRQHLEQQNFEAERIAAILDWYARIEASRRDDPFQKWLSSANAKLCERRFTVSPPPHHYPRLHETMGHGA
jgi:hypothetical protein